ncbi:hypothetical protein [Enterococcus larvae]|uniref:hypothetical protein n=1 Tax=Enterococcus larvae TaxID=2794352 RepID=UPI003F3528A7
MAKIRIGDRISGYAARLNTGSVSGRVISVRENTYTISTKQGNEVVKRIGAQKIMPVITKEKINEFLQDNNWSTSTQNVYRGHLGIFLSYIGDKEITNKAVKAFIASCDENEPAYKAANIRSVLYKYLDWIGFESEDLQVKSVKPEKKNKPSAETSVPIVDSDQTCENPDELKTTVQILDKSEKVCVMVGKAFLRVNPEATVVNLSLDHEVASDLSEKKEIAQQIAADYGGRLVKINTRTIMSEID